MVASVQEHAARINEEAGQQQYKHLQTLFATVHEVSVEYIWVFGRRQTVLRRRMTREVGEASM